MEASVSDAGTPPQDPYTRESLAQTLSLMGCKSRHAFKVSTRVFDTLEQMSGRSSRTSCQLRGRFPRGVLRGVQFEGAQARLTRPQFTALIAWALAEYKYASERQVIDIDIACRYASFCSISLTRIFLFLLTFRTFEMRQ